MDNVFFLIMRRMRLPLLSLIVAYAVAVTGMVLIPGVSSDGTPHHMSLFHAIYFVGYMSTTIGFGEVPGAFSDQQRLWVLMCIFATVGVWLYAIGALIALLQDKGLQQAIAERRFARQVERIGRPFYLICGCGQTGAMLVRGLTDRHLQVVVVDKDPQQVNLIDLDDQREFVPALCADARNPRTLALAGLEHRNCRGVIAVTGDNQANLKIAITAKLLHPKIEVTCRADSHEVEANMASFGTDHIFDPFDIFAVYLAVAIQAPCLTVLDDWLSSPRGEPLNEPLSPPAQGRWIICGYGRFGRAIYHHLKSEGLEVVVIEAAPHLTGIPPEGVIHGNGTRASTLEQAGIADAVGLVAGTDHDANNLSIIMTALELNRGLFVVARRNHVDNEDLFKRAGARAIMHPSTIVARQIRVQTITPLLAEFLTLVGFRDEAWACELVSRILGVADHQVPHVWEVTIDDAQAHAVCQQPAGAVSIAALLRDPRQRERSLRAICLLLVRGEESTLLPPEEDGLRPGDRLLLCGLERARSQMEWTLLNTRALRYAMWGETNRDGRLWQWLRVLWTRTEKRQAPPQS